MDWFADKYREIAERFGMVAADEPRLRDVDWRYGRQGNLYFAALLSFVLFVVLIDQEKIAARLGAVLVPMFWLWMLAEYFYWRKFMRPRAGDHRD
ncbi:hypothetical protein ACMYYO_00565 [Dermacoccaceae bacterium W4C1]